MAAEGAFPSAFMVVAPEVSRARARAGPIVALESAVLTHGLPHPQNVQVARKMEQAVRQEGAVPATIAVLGGTIRVGLTDGDLIRLGDNHSNLKISRRDLAAAILKGESGGTTVAATMFVALRAGIDVFATGEIGGVHSEDPSDVSADLPTLADTPLIVVCAGAKAILNLPATLEYLETVSVPVIGYGTEDLPAFYSRESGLKVSLRLDTAEAIAGFWMTHRSLGMRGAILVTNPIPEASAIARSEMAPIIAEASNEARKRNVRGQALTPFLLDRIGELTSARSLEANEALLLNNARLAAQIAIALATRTGHKEA